MPMGVWKTSHTTWRNKAIQIVQNMTWNKPINNGDMMDFAKANEFDKAMERNVAYLLNTAKDEK